MLFGSPMVASWTIWLGSGRLRCGRSSRSSVRLRSGGSSRSLVGSPSGRCRSGRCGGAVALSCSRVSGRRRSRSGSRQHSNRCWLRWQRLRQNAGDQLVHSGRGVVIAILIPGGQALAPNSLWLTKARISTSERNRAGITVDHTINYLVDVGERQFAFRSFVLAGIEVLVLL
jgi:hypothetical protein